jgi:hypothetical protein
MLAETWVHNMSARPCPTILGDCIGVDSPIIGLSSQAPDPRYYYASCTPGADAYSPPPLGGGIFVPSCDYILVAGNTQAEADALAAAICGPQIPSNPTVTTYYSNAVTVQVPCDPYPPAVIPLAIVTLPYGAFTSIISQADADSKALALATQVANARAAARNCDAYVLVGAGGDPVIGAGGEPVEPVSW